MRKVFVYGILKRGVEESKAKVHGFRMVDMGWFPAAIPHEDGTIHGELLEVTDDEVASFDRTEGHPNFYVRTDVEVEGQDGTKFDAEMYVIGKDHWHIQSEPTGSLEIRGQEFEYHLR